MDFAAAVREELARARQQNPPLNSLHEGWDVLKELVQIAAMAQRTAEDVVLRRFGGPVCGATVEALRELHPGADFS